ncbi:MULTISPECIES: cation-translocating P-type ATPase [unclassified Dietzia]|uniref:cation-translocating P-type ATPase n=1 Tax=unclassified Dietzia TaxID=2617939 RepID=UPI0015F9738F|nr:MULTISPECIES: cation-transporting P-type ATPase [unclassified Dietzia]MBB1023588.1 cation-transporting P-type ATPase [Dietzia sp. DQ12-76]MBB1028692.1 cation-transporting P-type ATPase [Dietzia sp. DQ11-38-2]
MPVASSSDSPAPSEAGLSSGEAADRLRADGRNALPTSRPRSPLLALAAQMVNFFALMLWVAAALAWVADMPALSLAIGVVVVVNGLFAFAQQYRADRAAAALEDLLPPQVRVVRDGKVVRISAEQLVVGDAVQLEAGDRISADLRLDTAVGLAVDESLLTGESAVVHPDAGDTAYAGTFVVEGAGSATVTATGTRTRLASVAVMTHSAARPTSPLTRQLHRVVRMVSLIAAGTGVASFVVLVALGTEASEGFLFAIGVTVALVPEGLLPTVTLSLARSAQVMARDRALVKRLEAVETLGTTTYICSDKTGTLTQNRMSVRRVWTPAGTVTVSGEGYAPEGEATGGACAIRAAALATASAAACVSGRPELVDGRWTARGDPMEVALVVAQARLDGQREPVRPERRRIPFDPRARCSGAVDDDWIHLLGAAESVLPRCSGSTVAAAQEVTAAGGEGLRVVAVARAVRPETGEGEPLPWECDGMELLGLLCLEDPPREGVADALGQCRRAGVAVAMLTGDHPDTAAAIARQIGLLGAGPDASARVIAGADLPVDDDELGELLDTDGTVVARITPEDKLRVARALQKRGHVVAMTGDGVNDGPALRQADIGVAMGAGGTDVAREAADVVLLDDHFATIVRAVELGRATWSNVRRFLTYHLTDNVAELTPFVVWALSGGTVPLALGVLQILAVDIGTDLLPALALGAEPARRQVMKGPLRTDSLLDGRILRRVFGVLGPTEALVVMSAFLAVLLMAGWSPGAAVDPGTLAAASGAAFAALVLGQFANALACRSESTWFGAIPLMSNTLLLWAQVSMLAALAVFLFVPPVHQVLGGTNPPLIGWVVAAIAIPAVLTADSLHKWRRRHGRA